MNNIKIMFGKFQERCREIENESIDCIITDPPYDKQSLYLWRYLGVFAERLLKPSCFCVAYSGWFYLPELINNVLKSNISWYALFSLYHKGFAKGLNQSNIQDRCKPILIFQKPPFKPLTNRAENFIISENREKEYHKWQQSLSGVKKCVEIFTKEGDLVLDPMAGSGTTAVACLELGRKCICIDSDKNVMNVIKGRLNDI